MSKTDPLFIKKKCNRKFNYQDNESKLVKVMYSLPTQVTESTITKKKYFLKNDFHILLYNKNKIK